MDARLVAISFFKTILPIQPSEFAYINHIYPWHRSWRKGVSTSIGNCSRAQPQILRKSEIVLFQWLNDIKLVRDQGHVWGLGIFGSPSKLVGHLKELSAVILSFMRSPLCELSSIGMNAASCSNAARHGGRMSVSGRLLPVATGSNGCSLPACRSNPMQMTGQVECKWVGKSVQLPRVWLRRRARWLWCHRESQANSWAHCSLSWGKARFGLFDQPILHAALIGVTWLG